MLEYKFDSASCMLAVKLLQSLFFACISFLSLSFFLSFSLFLSLFSLFISLFHALDTRIITSESRMPCISFIRSSRSVSRFVLHETKLLHNSSLHHLTILKLFLLSDIYIRINAKQQFHSLILNTDTQF